MQLDALVIIPRLGLEAHHHTKSRPKTSFERQNVEKESQVLGSKLLEQLLVRGFSRQRRCSEVVIDLQTSSILRAWCERSFSEMDKCCTSVYDYNKRR